MKPCSNCWLKPRAVRFVEHYFPPSFHHLGIVGRAGRGEIHDGRRRKLHAVIPSRQAAAAGILLLVLPVVAESPGAADGEDREHEQQERPRMRIARPMARPQRLPGPGRREGRRFERFAKMGQDLPNRPRIGHECDEPDVATTPITATSAVPTPTTRSSAAYRPPTATVLRASSGAIAGQRRPSAALRSATVPPDHSISPSSTPALRIRLWDLRSIRSRARQPWDPLAFSSAAWQEGAMDGPPCQWLRLPVELHLTR